MLLSIVVEYVYVAKSRYLLRYISHQSSLWKVLIIFLTDVSSTVVAFLIITPIFLVVAALSLGILSPNTVRGVEIGIRTDYLEKNVMLTYSSSLPHTYVNLTKTIYRDIQDHAENPLENFHTLAIYRREEIAPEGTWCDPPSPDGCTIQWRGIIYPTTTMLSTAFATTGWISFCAITLMSYRGIGSMITGARKFFLWLYDHPNMILLFWLACGPVCCISGRMIISFWLR